MNKPHGKDIATAERGVSLEHRHFAFIAATIALIEDERARHETAALFARECAGTNPKFNRARFLAACKLYDGTEGQDRESYSDTQDRESYTAD